MAKDIYKLRENAAAETMLRMAEDRGKAGVRIQAMVKYLEEHLFDPELDVQRLKRECGVTDHNIPSEFEKQLGRPPSRYIEDRRMETACRLLSHTELRIWEVGQLVGYSSVSSFSRAFSRWCGYRPSFWRRKHRPGEFMAEDRTHRTDLMSLDTVAKILVGAEDEQAREALEMLFREGAPDKYRALFEADEGEPSLWDFARSLCALESRTVISRQAVTSLVKQHEQAREVLARLEGLAEAAGFDLTADRLEYDMVLICHRQVDRMLRVPWDRLEQVIDSLRHTGSSLEAWVYIINTRMTNASAEEKKRLLEVRERVVNACEHFKMVWDIGSVEGILRRNQPFQRLLALVVDRRKTIVRYGRQLIRVLEVVVNYLEGLDSGEEFPAA